MYKAVSANNGEFHTEICVENICIQKKGPGKNTRPSLECRKNVY